MKASNVKTQTQQDDRQLHELSDINTEEVSIVDRAANKRRFIVVKRDGRATMAAELTEKEDGTFEEAQPAAEKPAVDAPASEDVAKQAITLPTPVKQTVVRALTEAGERLASALALAKAAKETDEKLPQPVPAALGKEVGAIATLLNSLVERYPSPKAKAADAAEVEKAGARMAKDRYTRFKQAVDMLASVLQELSPEPGPGTKQFGEDEEEERKKAVAAKPPEDEKAKAAKPPEDEEGKRAAARKADEALAALTGRVTELAKAVGSIASARDAGNAQPVEKSSRHEPAAVSWPRDMARPVNRDTVAKQNFWD